MCSIDKFCERMRYWCDSGNLGYDQSNRWDIREGGESDCSSLVIFALREAGFDTGSASYTGDLSYNLTRRGWTRIPFTSLSQIRRGDILLNDRDHVCAVISGSGPSATVAQASIGDGNRISGGQSGDQTGYETNTRQAYVYPNGWDCILRYQVSGSDTNETGTTLDISGFVDGNTVREWQRQCGTLVDGIVSGQAEYCRSSYPRITSVEFGGGGSSLMKRVQEIVGVPHPTGVIAGGTVCMIQGWLMLRGYDCSKDNAGVLDEATAKAIQESLNNEEWHV